MARSSAIHVGVLLATLAFVAPGSASADTQAEHLVALAEPVVADNVQARGAARFSGVFVVTNPRLVPRKYLPELPKAGAAVCGWVQANAPAGKTRFWATYATTDGVLGDAQVSVTIEDNNSADLSLDAMSRSARFLRGWRQYCVDAVHPE